MRRFLIALSVASAAIFAVGEANAADGCSYDYYGRLVCQRGATPGTPYYRQAPRPRYYEEAPAYGYAPAPRRQRCWYQKQRVWGPYGDEVRRVRVCR